MRASLARLASPPKAAAEALKELGVSVSDAGGKMRPMEDLLTDLYKATRKYGEVDRVSFFKDIAGEEAFTSFMALVDAAGDGSLPKLRKELEGARGEAERTAKVMANNLDGDLKSLGSAWEGLRIRIADLIDGPLRSVTQWLTRVVSKVTALAQAHPTLTRQLLIAGGALLAMTATVGSLSLAIGVLAGPLAKLRLGFSLLTGSMNAVRLLPALWGMVTGSVSLLGGAIGALFSPVGLIAAAFVAAAVLIWKYWEPIKAFYAGVFSGIMERLAPLRETFERFGPVFDVVRDGIIQVFNWFKSLLSPMESSKETLDKCTSAGEVFGRVLGGAIELVLTPTKALMDSLAWILEKLGVLPDEAERARKKIENASKAPVMWEWDPVLKKMVQKPWTPGPAPSDKVDDKKAINPETTNRSQTTIPVRYADSAKLLITQVSWLMRRKNSLAPAILSLRTCPAHLLFVGSGRSGRLRRSVSLPPQLLSHPWFRLRCLRRWSLLLRPAPARWRRLYDRQWHQFLQLPVTGSLLPPDLAVKFMFICITLLHRIPANWRNWLAKWSGQKWNGAPVPGVAVFTIKIEESWP